MKRYQLIPMGIAALMLAACVQNRGRQDVETPLKVSKAEIITSEEVLPYTEEEVRFQVRDITLAGTLTLPKYNYPHPAVILISGSRADDRNATVGNFKPFQLMADHLARRGVAVLRYDDRGVGESNGKFTLQYTIEEYTEDVLSALRLLLSRGDIQSRSIGLIGHSLGGVIAPLVASRSENVAFIVTLAGYGMLGKEIMASAREYLARRAGETEDEIQDLMQWESRINRVARSGEGFEELVVEAQARAKADFEALTPERREQYSSFEEYYNSTSDAFLLQFVPTPFYKHFLDYDPLPALEKVSCPVLMLLGEKDTQIRPEQNEPLMKAALAKAGNNDVIAITIPKAGHYFVDYSVSDTEFAPGVLDNIANWILKRVEIGT